MTDFEKKYYRPRIGTGSVKWDCLDGMYGSAELLSMWVADMDFCCPDSVKEAMLELAERNLYGYFMPPDGYFETFANWERERHGYEIKQQWLRHTHGVVTAIYRMIGALTQKGDACIILTPSYYPFMNAIEDTKRRLVCSRLKNDNGYYTPDFEDFENKIISENVKLFVLSSPQNPVGRIWKREELTALLDICRRRGVYVLSDEIHQDIELFGNKHTPTALCCSQPDFIVTLCSATKSFNLAGLSHSMVISQSEEILKKYDEFAETLHGGDNITGYVATKAAYQGGTNWLKDCLAQIEYNAVLLRQELARTLPEALLSPLEGTYLQWLDLSHYVKPEDLEELIVKKCGLAVDYGRQFFPPEDGGSECHIRLNLATCSDNILLAAEGLSKIAK